MEFQIQPQNRLLKLPYLKKAYDIQNIYHKTIGNNYYIDPTAIAVDFADLFTLSNDPNLCDISATLSRYQTSSTFRLSVTIDLQKRVNFTQLVDPVSTTNYIEMGYPIPLITFNPILANLVGTVYYNYGNDASNINNNSQVFSYTFTTNNETVFLNLNELYNEDIYSTSYTYPISVEFALLLNSYNIPVSLSPDAQTEYPYLIYGFENAGTITRYLPHVHLFDLLHKVDISSYQLPAGLLFRHSTQYDFIHILELIN